MKDYFLPLFKLLFPQMTHPIPIERDVKFQIAAYERPELTSHLFPIPSPQITSFALLP